MSALLNTQQAAARCNLSPRTLEKLRVTGGGPPFVRLGGSVRYQVDDLEAWIAAGRRLSTSDTPATSAGSPAGRPRRS
ncbi:MAG TPA: helix-turn-helix domain-containing protein [Thermoanaerobaculia bacterium]|nr:helix-turn-helix domain-containing protein [Thermoanaerobaculia bacterium]